MFPVLEELPDELSDVELDIEPCVETLPPSLLLVVPSVLDPPDSMVDVATCVVPEVPGIVVVEVAPVVVPSVPSPSSEGVESPQEMRRRTAQPCRMRGNDNPSHGTELGDERDAGAIVARAADRKFCAWRCLIFPSMECNRRER